MKMQQRRQVSPVIRTAQRQGSALVMTVGAMILVFSLLALAGDRIAAMNTLTKIDFASQQAAAAAEAVTSFREADLVELAASNELERLALNPDTELANDPWEGIEWFGDCLVRWRVEPVRVATPDGRWIANPPIAAAPTVISENVDYIENRLYYHFRILAEAHYLSDRNLIKKRDLTELDADDDLPWQNSKNGVVNVRSSRIVQMRLNSLFKYALFHAKEGPYGDIELGPGHNQNITGRVHTNGAIYIGTGGVKTGPNYKPTSGWGPALIGDATDEVDMVGIDGIYRFRKDSMINARRGLTSFIGVDPADPVYGDAVWFGDGNQDPSPMQPGYQVPVGGYLDDTMSSPIHRLNNLPIVNTNDSRSPKIMVEDFGAFMRDGIPGFMRGGIAGSATVVKTLSNIPSMGGRPFEDQALFGEGTQIWTTNVGDPSDISSWTVLPNNPPAAYYTDPANGDFNFVEVPEPVDIVTGMPVSIPVTQFAKKLYHTADPRNGVAANTSYAANSPSLGVDIDEDGDGKLDASSVVYDAQDWMVDAGGLKQFYQRQPRVVGADHANGVYTINGDDTTLEARNLVDLFDPSPMWDSNALPLGPGGASAVGSSLPGGGNFNYNGAPSLDLGHPYTYGGVTTTMGADDSFGDNEVPGIYLRWALWGKNDAQYGLVIRERRNQGIPIPDSIDDWEVKPDRPVISGAGSPIIVRLTRQVGTVSGNNEKTVAERIIFTNVADPSITFTVGTDNATNPPGTSYTEYDDNGDIVTGNSGAAWQQAGNGAGPPDRQTKQEGYYSEWAIALDGEWTVSADWTQNTSSRDREALYEVIGAANPFAEVFDQSSVPHGGGSYGFDGVVFDFSGSGGGAGDYINYMRSQFVVYFGPYDVTDLYFAYESLTVEADDELVCYERDVMDRREATFMQYSFWDQAAPAGVAYDEWKNYKINILTLNMRKTLDFLMNTDYGEISTAIPSSAGVPRVAGTPSGQMLNERFNGMIYAHRTRRSESYTPWDNVRYHPKCYGHWGQAGSLNVELPPDGRKPWSELPSSTWGNASNVGFDWKTVSGPAMTFHSSLRLTNAADLDYGIYYTDDHGTPGDTSDDYQAKKGLTFITPNACYVWGDYDTVKYCDSNGALGGRKAMTDPSYDSDDNYKLPPAAIFADYINILSNAWLDEDQTATGRTTASDTWMNTSVITNNIPSHIDGKGKVQPSEGAHNLIRYNESWGSSRTFHLLGSNVVMNTRRYSRSHIAYWGDTPSKGQDVYDPPNRDFQMNSDLFTRPGQPPFTPFGVQVVRTVSTVELGN